MRRTAEVGQQIRAGVGDSEVVAKSEETPVRLNVSRGAKRLALALRKVYLSIQRMSLSRVGDARALPHELMQNQNGLTHLVLKNLLSNTG